jgi:hypothetical protein
MHINDDRKYIFTVFFVTVIIAYLIVTRAVSIFNVFIPLYFYRCLKGAFHFKANMNMKIVQVNMFVYNPFGNLVCSQMFCIEDVHLHEEITIHLHLHDLKNQGFYITQVFIVNPCAGLFPNTLIRTSYNTFF